MLFRRIYHDSLAQASYLLACQASKEAIVVDPLRDPAPYLEAARQEGVRITQVTETHVHADFLSGAAALADATGAQLLLSGEGGGIGGYQRSGFPGARWLGDGDRIQVGQVRLDVLHTPGHTPEHLSFLVTDGATSDAAMGLLSGDFLFVGDVGRPDLLERAVGVQGSMEASARALFRSLQRVRSLPEFLQLWPGHGAGSACGKALGAVPQSTLGFELRANWAFGSSSEDEFVRAVLAGQPEPPAYFTRMKSLNAEGGPKGRAHPTAGEDALADSVRRGALAIDLRTPAEFAAGHLRGAINLPLGRSFLGWAGSVVSFDRDLVLVAAPTQLHAAEVARRDLALIGLDRVVGTLRADALGDDAQGTLASVDVTTVGARVAPSVTVVDVRNRSEWEAGHIPGARHVPLAELTSRLEELRGAGPLLVHCQGGSRSVVAASVLEAAGIERVSNLHGGYAAWARAGHAPAKGD
jgi:hydroxyacylglutathione hydrolase